MASRELEDLLHLTPDDRVIALEETYKQMSYAADDIWEAARAAADGLDASIARGNVNSWDGNHEWMEKYKVIELLMARMKRLQHRNMMIILAQEKLGELPASYFAKPS